MARCLSVCTFEKVDYIERVRQMGEDRDFPHDAAEKEFGYRLMTFYEGLKIEIDEYLKTVK